MMLTTTEQELILRMSRHIQACKCADGAALAAEATDALLATAQHKLALGQAALDRPSRAKPGRPGRIYIVECDPDWRGTAEGIPQAAAMVNETLAQYSHPEATPSSIQQAVSRKGFWFQLVETDNGAKGLTVRLAKEPAAPATEPAEAHDPKKLARAKPKKTGTKRASVQSEHETETNPETDAALRKRLSGR